MIETREHLIHLLTEAVQIEHNLLCSYLYAAFSLKRAGEPGLNAAPTVASSFTSPPTLPRVSNVRDRRVAP